MLKQGIGIGLAYAHAYTKVSPKEAMQTKALAV